MKRFLIFAMVIGLSITMSASAFAGIQATRHNLSSNRTGGAPTTSGSGGTTVYSTDQDQLCVWCHTPHAAVSGQGVPLWNKTITTATFTTYGTTIAGTAKATGINNMSKVCLTCHDGTLAINIVLNAPGSGGYVVAGNQIGAWQGLAAGNKMVSGVASYIGVDLTDDHPISIYYSAPSPTFADNPASLRSNTVSARGIDTAWITRSKSDTSIAGQLVYGYIECVSCHDPHSSTNATFLRGTTTGSKICLTCHDI